MLVGRLLGPVIGALLGLLNLGEPGEHCHCLWQAGMCVKYMQLRAPEFSDDFQIYLFIYLAVPGLSCSMWGL